MDFDWWRIGQAALLILFLIVIYPAMKWWNAHSPEAKAGDWPAALLALGGVVAFVFLLIAIVR